MTPYRVRYQTIEIGPHDVHLRTLRDRQQFNDDSHVAERAGISSATWPLFGVLWDASQVLAHHLLDYPIKNKRILEIGCGIGLSSLVLKMRSADITATDYHPEAERFLKINTALNDLASIPFVRTDWREKDDQLGRFDLLVGSDLLYESWHPAEVSAFLNHHANPTATVLIGDAGRGQGGRFCHALEEHGFIRQDDPPSEWIDRPKGRLLCLTRSLQ